ncbi:hypothetical protein [Aquicoccus sp. SU-CL01552]|uniref:hypothetical protein n=1 Tax=Aquicoccus sp. SU-CL01552 TaxID=3127656 RepID=UPI0031034372
MADNLPDATQEAIQLHGLVQGLNFLLTQGGDTMNAVYPLADLIEGKADQMAEDLARIQTQSTKGGDA